MALINFSYCIIQYDTIFITGVDGVVEKLEKLPKDLFAETVRCDITLGGHVQWEEKHYEFVLRKMPHVIDHFDILS